MNKPYRDIVLDILSIINYPKDRASYAEEAEKSVFTDAFINLAEKLPDDIKQHMEATKTEFQPFTEQDIEKVRQYISQDDLFNEIEKLSKEDIKEFVQELTPKVDAGQKEKLDAIVASLDEAPAPSAAVPTPVDATPAPASEAPAVPPMTPATPLTSTTE